MSAIDLCTKNGENNSSPTRRMISAILFGSICRFPCHNISTEWGVTSFLKSQLALDNFLVLCHIDDVKYIFW